MNMQFKHLRLLIVDDNRNNLFTLRALLEDHLDIEILEADSGIETLSLLLHQMVDLIILDVQMPDMDGFETATLLKSRKKTEHIPIVFLTAAYKSEEFKQKGFDVGATDYLTKPIDPPQLLSRVTSYLRFIEQERHHTNTLKQQKNELDTINQLLQTEINIRKQAEQAMFEAKNLAERANYAKSRFLANMSHELRTPLNAIIGYSEMMQEDLEEQGLTSDDMPDLAKIHSAGIHLLSLIDRVLDISKIEAGTVDVNINNHDIQQLIHDLQTALAPDLRKQKSHFSLDLAEDLGEIQTDSSKLQQILLNLINNAFKFTDNGDVKLSVRRDPDTQCFHFEVSDTGVGIDADQQNNIFQAFTQGDISSTRKYGGSGLGLTVSKKFAEILGGTLTVCSVAGQGSCFTLSLPIHPNTTNQPNQLAEA